MSNLVTTIVTVACSVIASSGFWAFILAKSTKNTARDEMLMGLAHDRIIQLGSSYIERGYITRDEYENLIDYLYKPYAKLGGNGTGEKVIEDVKRLPLK